MSGKTAAQISRRCETTCRIMPPSGSHATQRRQTRKRSPASFSSWAKPEQNMNDEMESGTKRDLSRRNILLAGSTLAAASALGSAAATVQATVAHAQSSGKRAEHSRHHGRRYRLVQHRRLSPRHHVGQDAEPRQARSRGHALHRLLRRGELHRRACQLHNRRDPDANRLDHGRPGWRRCRHARSIRDNWRCSSSPWAMPQGNSARTTSAT